MRAAQELAPTTWIFAALLAAAPAPAAAAPPVETTGALSSTSSIAPAEPLEALLDIDFVKSASLRAQSRFEAPVSITIITHAQIIESGALDVAEVLRRVVGVQVSATTANAYAAGLRGSNGPLSYRVAVYLDGRSLADIAFGYIKWSLLPINPEEIERIEVIRGPGATLYGANALSGVINIVSRKALDHPGLDASAVGTISVLPDSPQRAQGRDSVEGGAQGYVAHSWTNDARTLGLRANFGYSREREWLTDDDRPQHGDFDYHARIAFDLRPSPDVTFFAAIDHAAGENLIVDGSGATLRLVTADQALQLSFEDRRVLDLPVSLTLRGNGRRTLGSTGTREYHLYEGDATIQLDHSSFEDRNLLTVLGEFRATRVDDFFENSPRALFVGAALQDELKLLEDRSLLLSVGVRIDATRIDDDDDVDAIQYRNLNPRAAIVYLPAERQALRAAVTTAYRTPSVFQNFVEVLVGGDPVVPVLVGNYRLEPETILNGELGYVGTWLDTLNLEAVLFAQRARRVIGNSPELRLPFEWVNGPTVHQFGTELSASYDPTPALGLEARYTLTRSYDAASGDRKRNFPDHLLGFNAGLDVGRASHLAAEFDFVSSFAERIVRASPMTGRLSAAESTVANQYLVSARASHKISLGNAEIFVAARNIVGFFRPPALARQITDPAAHPIGGTVIVGLRVFEL